MLNISDINKSPQIGDLVQIIFILTRDDGSNTMKKRRKVDGDDILTIKLSRGKMQKTALGVINHDEIVGKPFGSALISDKGVKYYILPPTIAEATLSFPRGAAIIYPKDAAFIITYGDIAPGMSVLECGLGSGSLTCSLLRAVASNGSVTSIEKREDFYKTGTKNVYDFFCGNLPAVWQPINAELETVLNAISCPEQSNGIENHAELVDIYAKYDRIVLDLLNPWDYLESAHSVLNTGGIVIIYITTVTQMAQLEREFTRLSDKYINIECFENIRRPWKMDNLSIRPEHSGILHSGFIITARAV